MANLHKLNKNDLVKELRKTQQALASDGRHEKQLLHDLQVHQIELELQNRQLREAQQELEEARNRYADLYDFAPVGYLTLTPHGIITEANLTVSALLGTPRMQLIGMPLSSYLAKGENRTFFAHLKRLCDQEGGSVVSETALKPRSGDLKQVRLESVAGMSDAGNLACRTAIIDITERKRAEEGLRLAGAVLSSTPEGVMITDANLHIVMINPAFTTVTGYRESDVIGKKPDILKSGRHDEKFYRDMWQSLKREGNWKGEIWNRRKNGDVYAEWLIISEIKNTDDKVTHYAGIFGDVTDQTHARERLHRLAYYDPLTGLPNRELLHEKFETLMPMAKRHNNLLALLFLDLDQFKHINDSLGHAVGDELLKQASSRFQECVRRSDIVARVGGDEFILLLNDLHELKEVEVVAAKIAKAVEVPCTLEQAEHQVTVSIGISTYPQDGTDLTTLIKNADKAMYSAKKAGRNTYKFFEAN